MSESREKLIGDLVADLRPVGRPGRIMPLLAAWLAAAIPYTAAVLAATGPFRDGALHSLYSFPGFTVETAVAALAVWAIARMALLTGLPGAVAPSRAMAWPALLVAVWIGFYIVGFWHPVHPVSELGHRDHCYLQTQLFGLPTLAFMLWLARGLAPPWPALTGALAGAAAAAIPAEMMQFACMYEPEHILIYHLGPVAVTAALGAVLGPRVLSPRAVALRRRPGRLH